MVHLTVRNASQDSNQILPHAFRFVVMVFTLPAFNNAIVIILRDVQIVLLIVIIYVPQSMDPSLYAI